MASQIDKIYGNRVRVRVCGLCWQADALLLINHGGLTEGNFWAPPGGGVEFGQTAQQTLIREFREETGLIVAAGRFLVACEFIKKPFHAVELFFEVHIEGGRLKTGYDPEMKTEDQIIREAAFVEYAHILQTSETERHGLFNLFHTPESLKNASGYLKIG